MSKRILMIVTSHSAMGASGKATGVWAEELTAPYYIFLDAGMEVEIASPKGGKVRFDPASIKPKGQSEAHIERFLADPAAQRKVADTLVAAAADARGFDAVFSREDMAQCGTCRTMQALPAQWKPPLPPAR